MADENDTGEKSEQPTPRRLTKARADGMVGKSIDLAQVMGMIAAYLALQLVAPYLWKNILLIARTSFSTSLYNEPLTIPLLANEFLVLIKLLLPPLMLITFVAAFFGAGTGFLQTKFLWSWKLLKPRFSQLNPITGIKRLFSAQNLVNVIKSIAKLCIIGPIAYFAFFDLFPQMLRLIDIPITQFLPFAASAANHIFWRIIALLFVLGILDLIWQKYSTHKKLKMTKQEVKDEKKATEGDEKTKMQIRAKALQKARQRMMQAVPTADVVVTNPTHIAVALQYTLAKGNAPKVVAKGQGYLAERIKEIAREHNVPVLERKPLARALYKAVEVGQEIPYELFAAVAELLAYVYKLKNKNPFLNKARSQET